LTVAREVPSKHPLPILDVAYRSRQLTFRRTQISQWLSHEHTQLQEELAFRKSQGESLEDDYFSSRVANIEAEAVQQEKDALAMYGMLEGADPRVAPLRRALAVWGLTADDVGVLSIHGTSTGANVSIYI
jgi:fatty acid synthase subunit alpha